MKRIEILDTSLRDGSQAEGISYTIEDKLQIFAALDEFGIPLVECANIASNAKEREYFAEQLRRPRQNSVPVAFGSTRKKGIKASDDENLSELIRSHAACVSIVGKSSRFQVREVLRTDEAENLAMITDTVKLLCSAGVRVLFDCEHFFDGYRDDPDYALRCALSALEAGADRIVLCDTNGACLPDTAERIVETVVSYAGERVGVHFHNDLDCAVANSLSAVRAGAVHIQGTLLGYGERCGNAKLSAIIPSLQLKMKYPVVSEEQLNRLYATARRVALISDCPFDEASPYIGKNAFAHKGGMHIDAMRKNSASFEHIDPTLVGNERRILLSEVSGKGAIIEKAGQYVDFSGKDDEGVTKLLAVLKQKERQGYQYENADASFELLVKQVFDTYRQHFSVVLYRVIGEKTMGTLGNISSAIVKVAVGDKTAITADEGNGPVNALDKALRKALEVFFPSISQLRLTDYRVRVVNPGGASASVVRVLISSSGEDGAVFSTMGVSSDIIEASFKALIDSFAYFLMKHEPIAD